MNFIIYPKHKMSQKKIYKNQIIKSESNSLSRVGNTIKITHKLLEENDKRLAFSEIKSVQIGNQLWMTKNLNEDRFQNGDLILEVKTNEEWERVCQEGKPAWCYYNYDPANGEIYGKLYNCYALNDPRGLAPVGWRIPDYNDWSTLVGYFEYQSNDEKSIHPRGVMDFTLNYKDDSILSLETIGYRDFSPGFCDGISFYWSSTENEQKDVIFGIEYSNSSNAIWLFGFRKDSGFGLVVRCVKNEAI